jgi:hypothetical protein
MSKRVPARTFNWSIDADPQQQQEATALQVLVVRSSSR